MVGALNLAPGYTIGQSAQQIAFLTFLPGSDATIVLVFYWSRLAAQCFLEIVSLEVKLM